MKPTMTEWWFGKITHDFYHISNESIEVLKIKGERLEHHVREIESIVNEFSQERVLSIAFVGQYSAGKSTIVSALTGDRSIKIDADIATDCVTSYDWNGILLTDTPGLYTERKDHDEKTNRAIEVADLLVFIVTSDLFDDITVANFKQLAFENGFGHKMFLIVNKMSMEAGSYDELRLNYTQSLKDALSPYALDVFPISFIDAADYLEAKDDMDKDLIISSHFNEFLEQLNSFVSDRGLYGKLDVPLRRLKSELEKAMLPENENKEYFIILERIEDRIRRCMQHMERIVLVQTSNLRYTVVEQGNRLASTIGSSELETTKTQVEQEVVRAVDDTITAIEQLILEEITELQSQIDGVLQSDVAHALFEANGKVEYDIYFKEGFDVGGVKAVYDPIAEATNSFGNVVLKLAGQPSDGLLKATTAAGTQLHDTVYTIGKFFGHNFRPWEAANIAKDLGNFAQVVGPALSVFGAGLQAWQMYSEHERSEKLGAAKRECTNYFSSHAAKLQGDLTQQFSTFKTTFFVPMLEAISQQRREASDNDSSNSELNQQFSVYCRELEELLRLVSNRANSLAIEPEVIKS